MATSSLGPACSTAAAFCATTLPQMSAISTTADRALSGASAATCLWKKVLRAAPASTGSSTTCGAVWRGAGLCWFACVDDDMCQCMAGKQHQAETLTHHSPRTHLQGGDQQRRRVDGHQRAQQQLSQQRRGHNSTQLHMQGRGGWRISVLKSRQVAVPQVSRTKRPNPITAPPRRIPTLTSWSPWRQ